MAFDRVQAMYLAFDQVQACAFTGEIQRFHQRSIAVDRAVNQPKLLGHANKVESVRSAHQPLIVRHLCDGKEVEDATTIIIQHHDRSTSPGLRCQRQGREIMQAREISDQQ